MKSDKEQAIRLRQVVGLSLSIFCCSCSDAPGNFPKYDRSANRSEASRRVCGALNEILGPKGSTDIIDARRILRTALTENPLLPADALELKSIPYFKREINWMQDREPVSALQFEAAYVRVSMQFDKTGKVDPDRSYVLPINVL